VSAFAITGIKLTLVWSRRMNSTSICFKLYITRHRRYITETRLKGATYECPVGWMK
jgi:hypothetical protein